MPFEKGTVPPRLKGKGIPQKFVNIFINVWNSVYERTQDEGAAYRQAYGVMRKALLKAGYRKGDDGKWHKGEAEELARTANLVEEFSHDEVRSLLQAALDGRFGVAYGGSIGSAPTPWVRDVYSSHLIYSYDGKLYDLGYSLDEETGDVTLDAAPVQVHQEYEAVEEEEGMSQELLEGWLPAGMTWTDLDDGDFAWLSDAYRSASKKEREGMNKRQHRKLPYKVHGKVDRQGWKTAWKAITGTSYLHPSLKGGPGADTVIAKLKRDKPAGITIDKDNHFHDTRGEEVVGRNAVIAATDRQVSVVEGSEADAETKGLRVKGVALVDEAVSQGGTGRYYSTKFNDACKEATNAFMGSGGVVTMYSRHGRAIAPPGQLPTGLPIGKVDRPLFREGNEVMYEAFIAPTTEGKDVITLIKTGVMLATSIRAASYRSRMRKMGDLEIEELLEAVIIGIDLTDEAGIEGAGIKEVLEEAPQWTDEEQSEEEEEMVYEELTLKDLLERRKDLLDEYAASVKEALEAAATGDAPKALAELQKTHNAVLEEKEAALGKVAALEVEAAKLKLDLAIEAAAQIGVGKMVAEELRANVKAEADIASLLPAARDKALALVLASGREQVAGKGVSRFAEGEGDEDEDDEADVLTEEQKTIISLVL